ncbi:MAG: 3-hydroxyacyl-CoA dehydrogenase [Alphaproteobacteria bacterium]|nr:MAG: 3-hydroxyacyl-CoA dehydrogenase [Alphaproteobacteria bacterium]
MLSQNSTVAVLGAGAMGQAIAIVAARAGHPVLIYDVNLETARGAISKLKQTNDWLVSRGKINAAESEKQLGRISIATRLEDISNADLVIEAIVENLKVKSDLISRVESITRAKTIIATNTSALSITELAACLTKQERFVGLHFFNPADRLPLVEIVSGYKTSNETIDCLVTLTKKWDKIPVVCGSTPGFIVNRIARPFYGEAFLLLEEQVSDPATIDAIMCESGGFKMGPFYLTDMIGHDVNYAVTKSVYEAFYNDARYKPSLLQKELVQAGYLGRKSGQGIYSYEKGSEHPLPQTEPQMKKPKTVVFKGSLGQAEALFNLAEKAGIDVVREEGDNCIIVGDVRLALTDGRLAITHSSQYGPTILFDLALNYADASRICLSVPDELPLSLRHQAVGFFQALGKEVSIVKDVPGIVVMRTVAMLINEAVDALYLGIAKAEDIETAMLKGVNYPCGLLAWADQLGATLITNVLQNLASIYLDGRYRPSPLLIGRVNSSKSFVPEILNNDC